MVQVILDDGDERQVELSKVRLLPPNYQHVGKFSMLLVDVCFDTNISTVNLQIHLIIYV